MVYIVMGVSGCGKSTVGSAVAQRLGIPFYDGDDFHPEANRKKMSAGQPLNDDDRRPWLEALAAHIRAWNERGGAVLACSALKQCYRDILADSPPRGVSFLYLRGSRATLESRLAQRPEHFFDPALLDSQLDTLEEPADAITLDIDGPLDALIESAITAINMGRP